jgi:hypothetical protein
MDPNAFLTGRTRETNIRRDAEGRWFDGAEPLDHPNLLRAFERWLDRAEDGRYCLRNEINWAYVSLEGAPLFVRTVALNAEGVPLLWLSDGECEPLNPSSLREGEADGALYCDVRDGTWVARFERHAQVHLAPLLGEDDEGVYIAIAGERVRPPSVSDPLVPVSNVSDVTTSSTSGASQ